MVSRMVPGPAGHRWLAEAESVLWEIAAVQRATAVRSYLLSGSKGGDGEVGIRGPAAGAARTAPSEMMA